MSHTNSTTNYALPQFLTTDKPAWLTDINKAFSDIDSAVYAAKSKADTAFTDAGNAQTDATTAINNAAAADAKGSGAIASIEANFDPTTIYSVGAKVMYNSLLYRCIIAVVTPGPWTGSNNWERITVDSLISTTDSKIGNLSSLTTSDKSSLVGAVNEVNGKIKTYNWTGTNVAITTLYSGGSMYYCDVTFPSGEATDINEILALTLVDYGGLSNVLQFQIRGSRAFRIWSKTSMTLSALTVKVLYFK